MNAPLPQDALAAGPAAGSVRPDTAQTLSARRERQQRLVSALSGVLPAHALLWHAEDTIPYECDGLSAYRERPLLVALPETEAQVAAGLAADGRAILLLTDRASLLSACHRVHDLREVSRG